MLSWDSTTGAAPAGLGALLVVAGALGSCSGTAVIDADTQGGAAPAYTGSCPERVRQVACRAAPPTCRWNEFPAVHDDGSCWTGECLDCVEDCQREDDCVVVTACGCTYHEGCTFAFTRYEAVSLDSCFGSSVKPCTEDCPESVCGLLDCAWCDADSAACVANACEPVVSHPCD